MNILYFVDEERECSVDEMLSVSADFEKSLLQPDQAPAERKVEESPLPSEPEEVQEEVVEVHEEVPEVQEEVPEVQKEVAEVQEEVVEQEPEAETKEKQLETLAEEMPSTDGTLSNKPPSDF